MDRDILSIQKEEEAPHTPVQGGKGWILYTEQEGKRNRHYIALYQKACRKYGLSIELAIYNANGANEGSYGQIRQLVSRERPDFAVNRTRDHRLARVLEGLGVRVYNNSRVAELGNDKAKAYRFMEECQIPIMPTSYGAGMPEWFPAVVKTCSGHGGTEVSFLQDVQGWQDWKRELYRPDREYVVQQAASDLGRDLRVYVVGDRITAAVLRTSTQDFRSNLCLGGKAVLYTLSKAERGLVQRVASHFTIGMAGIDFLFHHGKLVFNEIEDMAGARGLYSLTDYDIVDDYVRYIKQDIAYTRVR